LTAEETMSPDQVDQAIRIKALVKAKKLESAGNLDGWRSSEIRLSKKTEQGT